MQIFTGSSAADVISKIGSSIADNIGGILAIFGLIVGMSIVAALIDWATGANYTTWRGPSGQSYKIRK